MDEKTHLCSLTRDLQSMLKTPDVMTVVEVEDDMLTERRERFRYCLVGRFLTPRHLNKAIAKQSILKAWRCKAPVQTVELETDTILFQFQILLDMKRVTANGPWCFNGHLLILEPWYEELISTSEVRFTHCPFSIRSHDMPFYTWRRPLGEN